MATEATWQETEEGDVRCLRHGEGERFSPHSSCTACVEEEMSTVESFFIICDPLDGNVQGARPSR